MRQKSLLYVVASILICSLLLFVLVTRNAAQTTPCQPPPGQGVTTVWSAGSTVNVYIDSRFGTSGQDIIAGQLGKWNSLAITFAIKANAADMGPGAIGGGNATYFIFRDTPDSSTAQGQTGGFSFNGRRGDSTTKINPGVTDPTALAQVASHEIGHSFGLGDCTSCAQNSSAMTLPRSLSVY